MRENRKTHISISDCRRGISFHLSVMHPTCIYSSLIQETENQAHVIGRPNKLFEQEIFELSLVSIESHFVSPHRTLTQISFHLAKEQSLNGRGLVSLLS